MNWIHFFRVGKTYRLFKEEQSPISSGIWPDRRFSLRSLYQKTRHHVARRTNKPYKCHNNIYCIHEWTKGKRKSLKESRKYMETKLLRFPIAGEISPSRFSPERLLPKKIGANQKREKWKLLVFINMKWEACIQCARVHCNSQCNNIEGDIITCNPSPNTIIWWWWVCPVI